MNYWDPIAETYGLNIEVVNRYVDPTFSFMTVLKKIPYCHGKVMVWVQ